MKPNLGVSIPLYQDTATYKKYRGKLVAATTKLTHIELTHKHSKETYVNRRSNADQNIFK